MIELINQDYSDFVNLSSNLIGLDKSISKLKTPLGQFKEEILVCYLVLYLSVNVYLHIRYLSY
jgi:hypothetical protein